MMNGCLMHSVIAGITLEQAKDVAAVAGGIFALIALIKGVVEYVHQGAQKRAEHFLAMRERLKGDAKFMQICDLLDEDSPTLRDLPFNDKRDFLGLFEEVALMLNSRIIRPAVAHYMFGYYAIRCGRSKYFWEGVERQSDYWSLFNDFVTRMEQVESSFKFKRRKLRF